MRSLGNAHDPLMSSPDRDSAARIALARSRAFTRRRTAQHELKQSLSDLAELYHSKSLAGPPAASPGPEVTALRRSEPKLMRRGERIRPQSAAASTLAI